MQAAKRFQTAVSRPSASLQVRGTCIHRHSNIIKLPLSSKGTCRRGVPPVSSTSSSRRASFTTTTAKMAPKLYTDETPDEVKNAKGLHLITMNTPNGQAVQVSLRHTPSKTNE